MARQVTGYVMARQIEEWQSFVREVLEPSFDGALEEWAMTPRAKRESKTPFEAQVWEQLTWFREQSTWFREHSTWLRERSTSDNV
jgi:hypothetical protein